MPSPFQHDHLEVKRELLTLAREYYKRSEEEKDNRESLAYTLAAALLYMNHADYLAQFIAHGISSLANNAVSTYFHGTIAVAGPGFKDMNIKKSMDKLKEYEFSRKKDVLEILGKVNESRNKVAHTILKTDPDKLSEVDSAVKSLREDTEKLIEISDEIRLGMPPKNLMDLVNEFKDSAPK